MREVYSKEKLEKLKPHQYKRLLGVDFANVYKMEITVEKAYLKNIKKVEEKVSLMHMRW